MGTATVMISVVISHLSSVAVVVLLLLLLDRVHSLPISLGDELPDWNITARYRGHCTWTDTTTAYTSSSSAIVGVAMRNRRIVIKLLWTPGLLVP